MNLKQAKSLRVGQLVYIKGEYDATGQPSKCKVTGKPHTWVTQPARVQVPVKRGLRGYGYITESILSQFTLTRPNSKKPQAVVASRARALGAPSSNWITDPHGPWRTQTGAEKFMNSQDRKYSDYRVHQAPNGLFYFQWKPKGMA
jgi:hypothetical protein